MADLASQIATLRAEFQSIAERHSWICIAFPPKGNERGSLWFGAIGGPPALSLGSIGVRIPESGPLRSVVDHVDSLTDKACRLLFKVLNGQHHMPAEIVEEIREWERQRYCQGWIRWLNYATVIQHVYRYENYPQVAATALMKLQDHCGADTGSDPPKKPKRPVKKPTIHDNFKQPVKLWPEFKSVQKQKGQRATLENFRDWLRSEHEIMIDDKFDKWWKNYYTRMQRRSSQGD